MPELIAAQEIKIQSAPQNMVQLSVTLDENQQASFQEAFKTPGQYIMASFSGEKEKALALACAPSSPKPTFLIKENDEYARKNLLNLTHSDVKLSLPLGKGFPFEKAAQKPILLAGVGSGLAPLLSALLHLEKDLSTRSITLLYGMRYKIDLPEAKTLKKLTEKGLNLHLVCSKEPATTTAENTSLQDCKQGYIQDHVHKLSLTPDTVVFMCGLRPMEEALTLELEKIHISKEQIFRNY